VGEAALRWMPAVFHPPAGLHVRLAIAEYLQRALGPRFPPPSLFREKVAAGELGRKTGRGFYTYT